MAFLIKWREVCKTALSDGVVMLYQSISKKEQFIIFQPTKIERWLLAQIEEIAKSVKNSATGRRLPADHDVPKFPCFHLLTRELLVVTPAVQLS
jgi:hypothetical protein